MYKRRSNASNLWGESFNTQIPQSPKDIITKANTPKVIEVSVEKVLKSKKTSLQERLQLITENVNKILGVYKSSTQVIRTLDELITYIDKAILNGVIAIDTETDNSLDPLTCKLMGACIYTPGMKNAYIPINHIDNNTGGLLCDQLKEEDIYNQFNRLQGIKILTHNGSFDYQVLKCTTGYLMPIYWDTMVGAKILDENERSHGLKQQYIQKIDPSIEKYSIEYLFENVLYAQVDPDIFALYAATDAYMTYKLYEYQKKQFEAVDNTRLYKLFMEVEMPLVEVVAEMELAGVNFDAEYNKRLSIKYNKMLEDTQAEIDEELRKLKPQIAAWRLTEDANIHPPKKRGKGDGKSKNEQLQDPVNIGSPTQLAILLYDILKVPVIDRKTPRGTGEPVLSQISLPICKAILKQRAAAKLVSTFIDKLPGIVSTKDGRIHTHFNQLGAATGRLSSSAPINLMNIPSGDHAIRMQFIAAPGYKLVGSDFSQQEPRLLSFYSQDDNMINAYKDGKDLYATVASGIYHNNYEDNLEFDKEGNRNPAGAKRRGDTKAVLLGLMYGRGAASIAEGTGVSLEEAQDIIDQFYRSFPKVKKWVDETQASAHKLGYVEDYYGRRRRLPDIQLPKYTIQLINKHSDFNPLFGTTGERACNNSPLVEHYKEETEKIRSAKDYENTKARALKDGVVISSNTGFISQAERQCVNARIQGGAGTMTKIAMNRIHRDAKLNEMGFRLLICVHDELIGEAPEQYAQECGERLAYLMKTCVEDIVNVPFKCDETIMHAWYEDTMQADIICAFDEAVKGGTAPVDAIRSIRAEHTELSEDQLQFMLGDKYIAA